MRNRYGSRAVTPTTNQPGFWETIGDQIPGLARGAYSGLLGLPGDVEEMAISGAPFALLSQGKISPQRFSNLATQNYSPGLLTSEEIADPLRKEGLLSKRPLEGEYTELAGNFLSPDFFIGDIAKLGALGLGASIFTSPAQKAVREVSKEALPSQQWLKQLEGRGVKKDELEWTGLLGFLKGKKGNIPKSEVEDYIDANKIDIREVVKGEGGIRLEQQYEDEPHIYSIFRADDPDGSFSGVVGEILERPPVFGYASMHVRGKTHYQINVPELHNREFSTLEEAKEYVSKNSDIGSTTKFGQYQLPGGENYRELVLTVDADKNPYTKKDIIPISSEEYIERGDRMHVKQRVQDADQFYWFDTPDGLKHWPKKDYKATDFLADDDVAEITPQVNRSPEEALEEVIRGMNEVKKSQPKYTQGHYDEPNVLSHIRFNERVDPDGNRVLFIEEIQSDWAQKGRKVGFSEPVPPETIAKLQKELSEKQAQFEEAAKKYFGGISARGREQNDLLHQINVTDHKDLAAHLGISNEEASTIFGLPMDMGALKTQLDSLNSGVQKAPFLEDTNQWAGLSMKRMIKWASDEGFDSIAWTTGKQQAKRYDLSKQISEVHLQGTDFQAFDHSGNQVIQRTGVREEDLPDLIGKEAAEKLMKQPNTAPTTSRYQRRSLKGQELEVGGEGMAGFYDKILVDQANKIGKKHGAKAEKVSLSVGKVAVKPEPVRLRYEVHDEQGAIDAFETREAAENALETAEGNYGGNPFVVDSYKKDMEEYNLQVDESIWKMKLPSKLKESAKEGLPYYALVPPGLLAVGAQRERQSLLE